MTYAADWESLATRPCPDWFRRARFGIFIHWGVYSVPAWNAKGYYAEWYWNHWKRSIADGAVRKFHEANYGRDFSYAEFAPQFRAELFAPDEWARLFRDAGARYVVLTAKHHDGYCLWPAPDSWNWNSVDVGPKRDLCDALSRAVRGHGVRMGLYYSLPEWFNPLYENEIDRYVDRKMLPQLKDLVRRYRPSLLFSDGEWYHPARTWRTAEFLAWLYNEGPNRDEVVVNDRWGPGYGRCGDYHTTEYGRGARIADAHAHPWEECRGVGKSFSYNRNENIHDYAGRTECVRMLIDLAARGGNLLLDIGPTADGRVPVIQQDRLLAIGRWLAANGESIYDTDRGPFAEPFPWGRATMKENTLYLHVYEWPRADGVLAVPGGITARACRAFLLADAERLPLPFEQSANGAVQVNLAGCFPEEHATVVAVEFESPPRVDTPGTPPEAAADITVSKPGDIVHDQGAE